MHVRICGSSREQSLERPGLYFPPGVNPGMTTYDVYGYIPGSYRALPASVRSAYEPGRYHLGQPGELRVRSPGKPDTDRITPISAAGNSVTMVRLSEGFQGYSNAIFNPPSHGIGGQSRSSAAARRIGLCARLSNRTTIRSLWISTAPPVATKRWYSCFGFDFS